MLYSRNYKSLSWKYEGHLNVLEKILHQYFKHLQTASLDLTSTSAENNHGPNLTNLNFESIKLNNTQLHILLRGRHYKTENKVQKKQERKATDTETV